MPDKLEAQATIEALDGAGLKGKKISVKEAEEQTRTGGYGGNSNNNNNNNNNRFNNRRY
jgi:hypothetical protein